MTREAISTSAAPAAIGAYSQAIRTSELVFCSGQIGLDPVTGEFVDSAVEAQTERVLHNLIGVLDSAGCSFADVVKVTIFLIDIADFPLVNAIYARYVDDPAPARSTVAVAALPRGARVEIEAVAVRR